VTAPPGSATGDRDAVTAIPTTDEVLAGVDLRGRTIVVTGATSGLGEETARALAAAGADVVLTGRSTDAAAGAAARISDRHPGASVTPLELELGSLGKVRTAVEKIRSLRPVLHGVIANAGVMAAPEGRTDDGFETHFGINHLGHFAFVTGLLPALEDGAPSRVVVLSSAGHRWDDIDLDDPNGEHRPYRRFRAYGASKTANVLFAVELDRRMRGRGIRAYAVHPGGIQTSLSRHLSEADKEKLKGGAAAQDTAFRTVPQGAATSVWAMTSPDLDDVGGVYLEDCAVAPVTGPEQTSGVREFAVDPDRARRLWDLSEALVAGGPSPDRQA
jgi:NAD(P)-dependent dehydrogenase (short-subunit alcohol dehydrogenase family)